MPRPCRRWSVLQLSMWQVVLLWCPCLAPRQRPWRLSNSPADRRRTSPERSSRRCCRRPRCRRPDGSLIPSPPTPTPCHHILCRSRQLHARWHQPRCPQAPWARNHHPDGHRRLQKHPPSPRRNCNCRLLHRLRHRHRASPLDPPLSETCHPQSHAGWARASSPAFIALHLPCLAPRVHPPQQTLCCRRRR